MDTLHECDLRASDLAKAFMIREVLQKWMALEYSWPLTQKEVIQNWVLVLFPKFTISFTFLLMEEGHFISTVMW